MSIDEHALSDLRRDAQDHARAHRWADYLGLVDGLRHDTEMWAPLWAPGAAVAAQSLGRDAEARGFLDEAISGGFFQPEIFDPEMTECFGSAPDWPELRTRMAANTPPSPIVVREFPTITPGPELQLFRIDTDREGELRGRLPETVGSAWETAQTLLRWTTLRWEHNNEHVERDDAVELLDLVDAGHRYACVEYSLLLSQALNAVGIPARRVSLLAANHHAGYGSGHVVSEAWIDDLEQWVVLDGQNGLYWHDAGTPLGLVELLRMYADQRPRPSVELLGRALSNEDLAGWWRYFAAASTTGAHWGGPDFVPYFQGEPRTSTPLLAEPGPAYPDLSEIGLSVEPVDGRAGLRLHSRHPFVTGFAISSPAHLTGGSTLTAGGSTQTPSGSAVVWPTLPPGDHLLTVAATTPYTTMRGHRLRIRTT